METTPKIVIVAAIGKNRELGNQNALLWHIPEDLKRFKEKTLGHPVIMGRKTFESIVAILGKPLPGRTNIVVTRNTDFAYAGIKVAHALKDAFSIAKEENPIEIHIGGGADLYAQALPFVDELYLTLVDDAPEADTFFPEFENMFDLVTTHEKKSHKNLTYQWVDYKRKQ
jgi:dihydrofolate reductase